MRFDASIWGPHYWFFLHTIAYTYPNHPNETIKRKYYDLLINFPLFIPNDKMAQEFATLLDKYPFTGYLDKRESFIRWVNFIHNKINYNLKKAEVPLLESIDDYILYYEHGKKEEGNIERIYYMDFIIRTLLILLLIFLIWILWNR